MVTEEARQVRGPGKAELVAADARRLVQHRVDRLLHANEGQKFDCTACGAVVHVWSGAYDYHDWRIVEDGN